MGSQKAALSKSAHKSVILISYVISRRLLSQIWDDVVFPASAPLAPNLLSPTEHLYAGYFLGDSLTAPSSKAEIIGIFLRLHF